MAYGESVHKHTRRGSEAMQRTRRPSIRAPPTNYHEPDEEEEPTIQLRLGDANLVYQDLQWILDGPVEGGKERASEALREITDKNRLLEAENQILRFKVTVMQDMLAGTKLDMLKLQAQT